MAENFPELLKDTNPHIWGSHKIWRKGEAEKGIGEGGEEKEEEDVEKEKEKEKSMPRPSTIGRTGYHTRI